MDAEIQKVSLSYEVGSTDPSLDVYKVDASFTTSYINPSFNVSFTVPTFDVAYTAATYDVRYVNLTPATIEIGIFLLKEALSDFGFIADQHTLFVGKNLSDAASFETTIRYDFGKVLTETAVATDSPAKRTGNRLRDDLSAVESIDTIGVFKGVFDAANFTFVTRFDTTKLLLESPTALDSLAANFSKPLVDNFAGADSPLLDIGKNIADIATGIDAQVLTAGKVLSNTADLSFSVALDTTKLLTDNIFVTDDIDGEASIEDDQNMLFTKTRTDIGTFSDLLSRTVNYSRSFADSSVSSDSTAIGVTKTLANAAAFLDVVTVDLVYTRSFSNSAAWQDDVSLGISTVLTDNGYAIESAVKSFDKGNSDSASVTDSGSLYGQDYVDNPFYFAEDYVGYSTTF